MNTTTNLRFLPKDTGGDGKPVAFVLARGMPVRANVGKMISKTDAPKSNKKMDNILKSLMIKNYAPEELSFTISLPHQDRKNQEINWFVKMRKCRNCAEILYLRLFAYQQMLNVHCEESVGAKRDNSCLVLTRT